MQTDFETKPEVEPAKPEASKDIDGIPYCRKHHCRMRRTSGGKKETGTIYYKCPVAACDCKSQIVKVRDAVVPQNPVPCPRCKEPACERDEHNSNAQAVIVACPKCGWKSTAMATPQFAELRFQRRRPAVAELGER